MGIMVEADRENSAARDPGHPIPDILVQQEEGIVTQGSHSYWRIHRPAFEHESSAEPIE